MRLASFFPGLAALVVLGAGCGARTPLLVPDDLPVAPDAAPPVLEHSGKVDLLFMIDNSGSMGDKQELLRQAIPDLLDRLIGPKCIDGAGTIVGDSVDGKCAVGKLEFKPVPDIHIALISSSLGSAGADTCAPDDPDPLNPSLLRHNDDDAHLLNRTRPDDAPVKEAQPSNFLAWFPDVDANKGNPKPPVTAMGDPKQLVRRFQDLVAGVGEHGCGFEAQLESWYRFLVQPDPYDHLEMQNGIVTLSGFDATIIKQRHDFLRPDSLLGVVVVTDEDDSNADPRALGGRAWMYLNSNFPGSPTAGPPKPTAACDATPLSPSCQSCAEPNTNCGPSPFYDAGDNPLNVRMFQVKRRFGVDIQFPLQRYVDGLSSATVPDRDGEHPGGSPGYVGDKRCTNPIFAKTLPGKVTTPDALCKLERGPRGTNLVYFAVIGGLPHQLLQKDPKDPDSPQKAALSTDDWTKILGKDPEHYDFSGADLHMLESITARPGLPGVGAKDDADPIHGREWDTGGGQLQFACTFPLPTPRDCTDASNLFCDCAKGLPALPPLCDAATPTLQRRAKAFPTLRELAVARALGDRASISSLCPIHVTEAQVNDPLYGYRPAIAGIVGAFRKGLVQ